MSKDDKIPLKILDLGMKKFSDDPKYILAYLEFLAHKNGTKKPQYYRGRARLGRTPSACTVERPRLREAT